MDPADLDELLGEPDPTSKGSDVSPRMNFVPPPELPTPECASIQARAKALGIDALVWLAAVVLLGIIYGGISSSNGLFRIKIGGPPLLMATVLWLAYMTLMEAKYGGSVGKRVRGLRVVMEDGDPVTPEAALTRNLMRFLDAFPYVVPYLVGAVAISNSPRMQRFGDRVAETMVVISLPASPDRRDAGLPPLLPLLGSDPPPVPSPRRKRRLLVVVVVTLLVVVGGGATAAFFLMRGTS
ncbi:MAG: RDD family protein [Actinobacteria bacterium]|nr:RDD family protein [Actinomycetota bacterium]